MIKSITASTREIDDADAAVSEITAALDPGNLKKNSIGIISCFSDFCDTGVLKAVCDALPFDCIGATTCLCATEKEIDQIFLTITVLTSDDCEFLTTYIPVSENYEERITSALAGSLEKNGEKPAMLLSFFPLMNSLSGDMILTAVDKVTGGIPLFGTAAVDHNVDYSTSKTIYNGESFREAVVLGAIYGEPKVTFEIASLEENKIRSQKAIITKSDGNMLINVNGKTALEYFEEIGLTKDDLTVGLGMIPFVVDYKDGTKAVARAAFTITPEGHVACGGAMPENATLAIGNIDGTDIVNTSESAIKPLLDKDSFILSYSCAGRYFILGANSTAEAEKISELAEDTQYMFACSGGEICPLPNSEGKLKNYYHNFTNVICRFS